MKICGKCRHLKAFTCFYKHKGYVDGHGNTCKECRKPEAPRGERAQKINFEKSIDRYTKLGFTVEQAKQKYYTCTARKALSKNLDKEGRKALLLEYRKQYHREHANEFKVKRAPYFAAYRKTAAFSAAMHNRRAKERGAGRHSAKEWQFILELCNHSCAACGKHESEESFPLTARGTKKLTKDHIIPISRGGSNTSDNLQPLCWDCHKIKGLKVINYLEKFKTIAHFQDC